MASDGDLADRLRELEKLHASLRAMSATLDLGELVRTVLDAIKSVTTPEGLSLLLHDPERDELVFAASETLGEETLVGRPAAPAREPGLEPERLAVAIPRDGRRIGLLELRERWDGRPFDEADRARAEAFATELATTVRSTPSSHASRPSCRATRARSCCTTRKDATSCSRPRACSVRASSTASG
jgi:hypothetical protein